MSNTMESNNDDTLTMEQMAKMLKVMQKRVAELEAAASDAVPRPNKVVVRNGKDVLLHYPELLEEYPVIAQPKFYDTILEPDDRFIQWNDFYLTDGMAYNPPPVLQHAKVKLPDPSRKHESDLIKIQGFIASSTRFLDTFADEIVDSENRTTKLGQRIIDFLSTMRVLASNDASKISKMRKKLYTEALGRREDDGEIAHHTHTLDNGIRKTYRKYTRDNSAWT
ncbi:hypothetical protein EMPS_00100 [Entomortierella parvispora]|uniref:Uncharacterized protein n=1 Tax=Entomortierella parvispora TaxID=205924 RepID=A0A9P3GZ98_9FUNG|nr:hypothetical protein EMPS_00100 [Entomortierella parvispora]